ncbi:MAG: M1 family metallopeptidase [Planctomycetota bacterium]
MSLPFHGCRAAGLLVALASLAAQDSPLRYAMQVELLPAERALSGRQRIHWTNTSRFPVQELRFHLYLNAFESLETTHMREAGEEFQAQWRASDLGGIQVDSVKLDDAESEVDLTQTMRFERPEDGNPDDRTVLVVELPVPVAPGAAIALRTAFTAKLPKANRRSGWVPGDGYYCMHWFPKLGVLEDRGGKPVWNCHQFHAHTEFFADFASYDVEITVPESFVVGATGSLQPERTRRSGATKTLAYTADQVHDFAWVADPDFREHVEVFGPHSAADDPLAVAVAARQGVPVSEFDLPRTEIRLLLRPEHDTDEQRRRHIEAVRCAMMFYGLRFGPYPYPSITVVDPGRDVTGRSLGGGMEYPTLITCGTKLFPHGREMRPEGVTVHEFGHQYWYGLSANNEFEESWLDEGLNSYAEGRAQWLWYRLRTFPTETQQFGLLTLGSVAGPVPLAQPRLRDSVAHVLPVDWAAWLREVDMPAALAPASPLLSLLGDLPMATYPREVPFDDSLQDRRRWLAAATSDPMVLPGWEYLNRASYTANSYHRPATILRTLERLVGREIWWAFMRRFHMEARFRHPTTEEFTRMLAEMCGREAADYFNGAIAAQAVLDYGVERVEPPDGRGPAKTIVVRRYGSQPARVRIRFKFENRVAYRETRANDTAATWRFRFEDPADGEAFGRLLEVWVDPPEGSPDTRESFEQGSWPAGVYLTDENLLNNAWRAEPDHGPALLRGLRLLLQTQARLSFAALAG